MLCFSGSRLLDIRTLVSRVLRRARGFGPKMFVLACRALYLVFTGFRRERIKLRAAALTYVSLLSLIARAGGGALDLCGLWRFGRRKGALQAAVVDALAVTHRDKITEFIELYVGNVHAGRIGGFGVVILFFTVISLLTNIERSFNDIWGLHRDQKFPPAFSGLWPPDHLGAGLAGLSLSVGTRIQTSDTFRLWADSVPGVQFLARFGPFLLAATFFFSFLYKIMPNTVVLTRRSLGCGWPAGWFM